MIFMSLDFFTRIISFLFFLGEEEKFKCIRTDMCVEYFFFLRTKREWSTCVIITTQRRRKDLCKSNESFFPVLLFFQENLHFDSDEKLTLYKTWHQIWYFSSFHWCWLIPSVNIYLYRYEEVLTELKKRRKRKSCQGKEISTSHNWRQLSSIRWQNEAFFRSVLLLIRNAKQNKSFLFRFNEIVQ